MSLNRHAVALKLREHLERRLSVLLDCTPEDIAELKIKIGTLVHIIYTLAGDQPSLAGFPTTIHGILQLIGFNLVWDVSEEPTKPDDKPEKVTVN